MADPRKPQQPLPTPAQPAQRARGKHGGCDPAMCAYCQNPDAPSTKAAEKRYAHEFAVFGQLPSAASAAAPDAQDENDEQRPPAAADDDDRRHG